MEVKQFGKQRETHPEYIGKCLKAWIYRSDESGCMQRGHDVADETAQNATETDQKRHMTAVWGGCLRSDVPPTRNISMNKPSVWGSGGGPFLPI